MIYPSLPARAEPLRERIAAAYRADETACVAALAERAALPSEARRQVRERARRLVTGVRSRRRLFGGLDVFLNEYGLGTAEGVAVMCLAEALLRIPDSATADRLIRDKLAGVDWARHLGHSESLFVNASTWGLMLTGRVVALDQGDVRDPAALLGRLVARSGEPVIRQALTHAMRVIGGQFVMGRTIEEALERSREAEARRYRYSFDMLGEAALTADAAEAYYAAYHHAIEAAGAQAEPGPLEDRPGVSVKLSALSPRYQEAQRARVLAEVTPRLAALARAARGAGIALTIDAEEADRLELQLDLFEAVAADPELAGWPGFGLAIQAYQKRALPVIDWLAARARRQRRVIPLRLVKGAYWDSEIKRAQELGLDGFPVFTRKCATDVSFLACARAILEGPDAFYGQFATHNAQAVATIATLAEGRRDYEFQRLHGMGEALYEQVIAPEGFGVACRVYAPVGGHADLLPYLVRRLLENGANTSFVNRIVDDQAPVAQLIADPVDQVRAVRAAPHPAIRAPAALFGPERRNARGLDLSDRLVLASLAEAMARALDEPRRAAPLVDGETRAGDEREVRDPADRRRLVGTVVDADEAALEAALATALRAAPDWDATPAEDRAARLESLADLLEAHMAEAMALMVREAGKTVADALADLREAVDHCRYNACEARRRFASPLALPGPAGEANTLSLHGRGTFACISPWNFPMAIFTGQVSAALAAGNAVLAKPAEQTPLCADFVVRLAHRAGVPPAVLQLLPGPGETVGARLAADPRVAGVVFTGSTGTARAITRALAGRTGAIVPLIAETGGQNAMIADSSALPEQLVGDVVRSAFGSAGQRCSCLRVLFLQEELAPRVLDMLAGAMAELRVGDPGLLDTDVGPIIDEEARAALTAHEERMAREGRHIAATPVTGACRYGVFFGPLAVEIDAIERLAGEVFGPVLHVVRYPAARLDAVVDAINATGYGLTMGIHSRIDATVARIVARARVGNIYVNRNMVGAVVGTQPFGGEGLSGTGPKAGGPNYLQRFAVERSLSVNTAAAGGNAALMSLGDDG